MFIIHTLRGKTSIMEVKIQRLSGVDDPSCLFLPLGEYKAYVLEPKLFHEPKKDGSLAPPIWFSHSFHFSEEHVNYAVKEMILKDFERNLRKNGASYTSEDVNAKIKEIQVIYL